MRVEDNLDIDFWNRELEGIDFELPASVEKDPIKQAFRNKMRHLRESDEVEHLLLLGLLNEWVDWPSLSGGEKFELWDIIEGQIECMTRKKRMTPSEFIDYVFKPEPDTGSYNSEKMMLRFLV